MSLSRFMHPRNPYKNNRPDFKKLALEHEEFRKVAKQSMNGSVTLDFKDPACLMALTQALLKNDFQLDVEFPSDRLIPAVPQRVNYILWLEDIFSENKLNLTGIDIGCGCSCIYALLGHKMNSWRFVCAEIDQTNLKYARENVSRNNYSDSITILEGDATLLQSSITHLENNPAKVRQGEETNSSNADPDTVRDKGEGRVVRDEGEGRVGEERVADFCMCNPPFYDPSISDESGSVRGKPRPEAKHTTSASETEKYVSGGEVEFVKKIIDESLVLKHKIRVYTSMVGKKSSLPKLKAYLREKGIASMSTTEFCQGRTMRWAVAWSFDNSITYPKSHFRTEKSRGKTVFSHTVSPDISCCVYDVPDITQKVKDILLDHLQMRVTTLHQDVGEFVCVVTARKNTWSHNRRNRRREKRLQHQAELLKEKAEHSSDDLCPPVKKIKLSSSDESPEKTANQETVTEQSTNTSSDLTISANQMTDGEESSSDEAPLITFSLEVKLKGVSIKLYVKLIDGEQKDALHQILQYFKNRLV